MPRLTGAEHSPAANVAPGNLEQAATGTETVDASIPEEGVYAPRRPQNVRAEEEADTESRSWRGVFVVTPEQEVLFSHEVELRTADLPEWEPKITLNPRWLSTDDE